MNNPDLICRVCRRNGSFTAPISVVLVFAHQLEKPFPLIPSEEYRVCAACEALYRFIDKAIATHPTTREAGPWTRTIVLFDDGQGVEVTPERGRQFVAMA